MTKPINLVLSGGGARRSRLRDSSNRRHVGGSNRGRTARSRIHARRLPGKVISLLAEKGVYEGGFFCEWYDEKLGAKNVRTFGDLGEGSACRFWAFAADITNGKLFCFPSDLGNTDIDPSTYQISRAVRASVSLPFYYEPVKLDGRYLVDGGILSNFPIDAFEDDPLPTIGIKLSAEPGAVAKPHTITRSGQLRRGRFQHHAQRPRPSPPEQPRLARQDDFCRYTGRPRDRFRPEREDAE